MCYYIYPGDIQQYILYQNIVDIRKLRDRKLYSFPGLHNNPYMAMVHIEEGNILTEKEVIFLSLQRR